MRSVKKASLDMDMMARMRVLEGALGYPKWSLSKDPGKIRKALKELPYQYPEIDPSWFATRDYGLYEAVLFGAKSVLSTEAGEATAEEVAQNMAAGLSISGDVRKDIYGEMGKYVGPKIQSGKIKPSGLKKLLSAMAKRRALDVYRKRFKTWRKDVDGATEIHLDTSGGTVSISADVVLDRSPLEVMLSLLSGPQGRKFQNWMFQTMQRKANPKQVAILEAWLDNPGATNKQIGESDQVKAVFGRPISGQMAGRVRDQLVDQIKTEIEKQPKVLDWVDRYLDLSALGYGGGQLRRAKRVAHRWLQYQSIK